MLFIYLYLLDYEFNKKLFFDQTFLTWIDLESVTLHQIFDAHERCN